MNIRQKANASSKSLGTVGAGTYKWTKQSGVWVYIPKFGGWINGAYKNYTSTKKYDTGGYTGSWGTSGKLAILHEKELVLNKDDTKNMLEAIKQLREYYNAFKSSQMETWRNELDSMFAQAAMINTPTYSSEGSGDTIIIEEANVNMEIKRMNNDYDARRAGEAALDEMVKIARKTNTLGVARR